jgi:hypothetical protein
MGFGRPVRDESKGASLAFRLLKLLPWRATWRSVSQTLS